MLADRQQFDMGEPQIGGVRDQRVPPTRPRYRRGHRGGGALGRRHGPRRWTAVRGGRRASCARRSRRRRSRRNCLRAARRWRRWRGRSSAAKATGSAFRGRTTPSRPAAPRTCRASPSADAGDEDLPDTDADAPAHRVTAAVPAVEIADHRYPRRHSGAQTAKCTPGDAFVDVSGCAPSALVRDRPVRAFAPAASRRARPAPGQSA